MSTFRAGWISCTNMERLCCSHRAVKKRHVALPHGRMHSSKGFSSEQVSIICKETLRINERAMCRPHRKGKPRNKAPRPAMRQSRGDAKGRPSHPVRAGLRVTRGLHTSGETRANVCLLPRRGSLNAGFATPFLRSLMLRTCERASRAGTTNEPLSSPSGKRIRSSATKALHKGINCFPVSRTSTDLEWRTKIVFLEVHKTVSISSGMPSSLYRATNSCHSALVSKTILADTEPALQKILVGLLCGAMPEFSKTLLNHSVTPVRYCAHGNRIRTALRACSSSGLADVSSLRLVFLLSSDDPGPWDPVAVEPSTCSSEGQDLAEPDTLDAEAAMFRPCTTVQ